MTKYSTRVSQSREEWLKERKSYIGGSDACSVVSTADNPIGRYGCQRKLFFDKKGVEKDFDDSDRAEFKRGHRLESVAANYYEEATGREVRYTVRSAVPGKPHLSVSMDRIVIAKERTSPGYLEIKTVGRWSMQNVKKNGPIDDYVLQVQWGMAVMRYSWGAFCFYCPETDELLHWDFEADKALGETLLEKGDDFWNFNVSLNIEPDPLPDGSKACEGCPWAITCRGGVEEKQDAGIVMRPDLEGLVSKFAEIKGMASEVGQTEDELKQEFKAAVKDTPGTYICGKWKIEFTSVSSKRFSSELLKKKYPAIYEECRQDTVTNTVKRPKEK